MVGVGAQPGFLFLFLYSWHTHRKSTLNTDTYVHDGLYIDGSQLNPKRKRVYRVVCFIFIYLVIPFTIYIHVIYIEVSLLCVCYCDWCVYLLLVTLVFLYFLLVFGCNLMSC